MSTPVIRSGAATFTTGGSSATLSVTKPTGTQTGDLILIWCASGWTSMTWTATGFTAVTAVAATNGSAQLLYRKTDGTEGASFTVTMGTIHPWDAGVISLGDIDASLFDPTPATSGQVNASSATVTVPGVTTTKNGDLLVWFGFVHAASGNPPPAPGTITLPAGFAAPSGVVQANSSAVSTANVGLLFGTTTQVTAGATGNENGSLSTTSYNGGLLVAVPGPTAPPAAGTYGLVGAYMDPAVYGLTGSTADQATTVATFNSITGRKIGVRRSAYGFRAIPKSYSTDVPASLGGGGAGVANMGAALGPVKDGDPSIQTWINTVGRALQVRHYFEGSPPASYAGSAYSKSAGVRRMLVDFEMAHDGSEATAFDTFLGSCQSAGLDMDVTLYHQAEPSKFTSPSALFSALGHYVPIITKHGYRHVWDTTDYVTHHYADWRSYYPGSVVQVDAIGIEHYVKQYLAGYRLDGPSAAGESVVAFAHRMGVPLGLSEFGADFGSACNEAQGLAFITYVHDLFHNQIAANLAEGVWDIVNWNTVSGNTGPGFPITAQPASWITEYQKIWDLLNKSSPGSPFN